MSRDAVTIVKFSTRAACNSYYANHASRLVSQGYLGIDFSRKENSRRVASSVVFSS